MTDLPTILVTGGAGFIGGALVRLLVGSGGWQVVNVDRLSYAASPEALQGLDPARHRLVQADIRDRAKMAALLAECRPRGIIHLAAETHVDRSIDGPDAFVEHNLVGTFHLLEAARQYWAGLEAQLAQDFRFLQVSTDEVFGSLAPGENAFEPDSPYRPSSPYAATKAGADHLARSWGTTYGLPVIVTHCSNNYGPWQFPEKLIPLMIIKGLAGEPLPVYGNGENIRDWLHVDDHAQGLLAAFERGQPGRTYLLGGGEERRNIDLVHAICDILDALRPDGQPRRRLVTLVEDRPGHDFRYAVDARPTCEALRWRPGMSFGTGLRATVEWYLAKQAWWQSVLARNYDGHRLGLAR